MKEMLKIQIYRDKLIFKTVISKSPSGQLVIVVKLYCNTISTRTCTIGNKNNNYNSSVSATKDHNLRFNIGFYARLILITKYTPQFTRSFKLSVNILPLQCLNITIRMKSNNHHALKQS